MTKTVRDLNFDYIIGNGSTMENVHVRQRLKILTSNATVGPYAIGAEYLPGSTKIVAFNNDFYPTSIDPDLGEYHETDSNTTITFISKQNVPGNGKKFRVFYTPAKQ